MPLSIEQRGEIKTLLQGKLDEKLARYSRESSAMPFLTRLFQDEEMVASYSFVHSVVTTLGMSVYEEASRIVASASAEKAETGINLEGVISPAQQQAIIEILRALKEGQRTANKDRECMEILRASRDAAKRQKSKVDFFMRRGGRDYCFEIKTVKPNIDVFKESKEKLLRWIALAGREIETILALPYNPYDPEPYERFTMQGLLEAKRELLVAESYWDFLGGKDTYRDLLEVFDEIGKDYHTKIKQKIAEVAKRHRLT